MADYPLDALGTLRERIEDDAEAALVDALEAREAAEGRCEAAREALAAHRTAESARRAVEAARPTDRASDLLREEAYRRRQDGRAAELAAALVRARREQERAAEAVEATRRALGQAAADRLVVDRHRGRWEAARSDQAQKREDEELEEGASRRKN